MELKKIKARAHRGLRGRAEAGFSAGGRCYGYTSEKIDPTVEKSRYRKVVNPRQAKVVVEIFEMYAAVMSPKAIAAELNRRRVPSPTARGGSARAVRQATARGEAARSMETPSPVPTYCAIRCTEASTSGTAPSGRRKAAVSSICHPRV